MTGRIPLWIDLRGIPVNKRLPFLHSSEEIAAEGVLLARGDPHADRPGIHAVLLDGHQRLKRNGTAIGRLVVLTDAKAQAKAARAEGIVVVDAPDWRIIPLENLIAARQDRPGTLYAVAKSPADAALLADVLQTGVHGIVLAPPTTAALFETDRLLRERTTARVPPTPTPAGARTTKTAGPHATDQTAAEATLPRDAAQAERPFLEPARVTRLESGGLGDRVCIDTTSLFRDGEGLLVGSTARSFVLVHAETLETEFVRARPFRVNAGAVHMYLYAPESRTRYLSELRAGEPVLAVHPDGIHRVLVLGRAKIERRPHTLVHWELPDGPTGMAMLQNAETIRLVKPDGTRVAVTDLRVGDTILVHQETAARHTGIAVDGDLEER